MHKIWMAIPLIALAGFLFSCNIINPPEDIPAYIKIDTILVKVTNFEQGSANHKISCVKINVGGTSLGFFQLPTMTPCLMTGLQSLYIEPGIELNGITGSRTVYPFFKPFTGTNKIDLVAGEVITITPLTTYKAECKFAWMEDFEDAGVSLLYPAYSDTTIRIQQDSVLEGHYSGAAYLDAKNRYFEGYSSTDFVLPKNGSMILMEFDYRSTTLLECGMYIIEEEAAIWYPLVIVRPSQKCNRIYIDLGTTVAEYQTAEFFRPGIRSVWDSTGSARQAIILDNLKLIHF